MKKILLLGAGYANMSLLSSLHKTFFKKAEFTLITQKPYHYKTIALHDVATGKHNEDILFKLDEIVAKDVKIIEDKVTSIEEKKVHTQKGEYEYDYLVVGLGFMSNDFGVKGVSEYSLSISSYDDALKIKEHIESKINSYKNSGDELDLSFIICGGGFTGIELVSSLAEELAQKLEADDFAKVKIYCIEALPNILTMFSPNLMQIGLEKLTQMGVQVLCNSKILECKENSIIIEKEGEQSEIKAHTIIWTAGVKGNPVIAASPLFESANNKVVVNNKLQAPNLKHIFIAGDCAALKDEKTGRFFPPTAQIAREQGKYLARVFEQILINDGLYDESVSPDFHFSPKGSLCSLGDHFALGVVAGKEMSGKMASHLKKIVEALWVNQLQGPIIAFKKLF